MRFKIKTKRKNDGYDKHLMRPGQPASALEPRHSILELQRMLGNKRVSGLLQTEQDTAAGGRPAKQRNKADANPARGSFFTPGVRQVMSASGSPLEPEFRREAEERLGQDFSAVRVHTGPDAERSADEIGAAAYTHGDHITFGRGGCGTDASAGRKILAHELAHVVQQRRGGHRPPSPARDGYLERSADRASSAFVSGRGAVSVGGGALPGVARIPRSIDQSLNTQLMRDDELQMEIQEIRAWLTANPGASPDRINLEQALADLEAEAARRPSIASQGTVAHTGTIGTGASQGTIEARTNEVIAASGGQIRNVLAISYSGANAANARWLQFVWFEMSVVSPTVTGRVSGTIPTTSGTKPFTTDPAAPSWSIDSASGGSPFYIYGGGLGIRDASTQTLFDRPGGTSVGPLFQSALSAVPGATSATFTAHFSTYLMINDVVQYLVPWAAATTATVSGTTATIANVAYTVGAAGAASSLPANLRTILHTNYTSYTHVR